VDGSEVGLPASLPQQLGRWHANPIAEADARRLLARGRRSTQQAYRRGASSLPGEIERMVASFALGCLPTDELVSLIHASTNPAERALLQLLLGQLLMSRRVEGATQWLRSGFDSAHDLFLPEDFFAVMKRHELLAELPLYARPRAPVDLDTLLQEAAVIRRLRGRRHPRGSYDGSDTVG
jgi:hypothetical protein